MDTKYRICKRCIMDTSDPEIVFDDRGYCNHCTAFFEKKATYPHNLPADEKKRELADIVAKIKKAGKGRQYDCVIGVSGGVDSTYIAYKMKELGLRPLAVHLDNGWNSELAIKNIELALKRLNIDLCTYVLDWEEFRDLQLSFLKASVPDLEIPTDHAILPVLFDAASKRNIKYVIGGENFATESILPRRWSTGHYDWPYIKNVQKKFGTKKLKTYPHMSLFTLFHQVVIKGITRIGLLNYMDYDKKAAMQVLSRELGWKNYGTKHGESAYTKFIQSYILPKKFAFDKRRAHLSNLICSGQITREEALMRLAEPLFSKQELEETIEYTCDKLEISREEFERLMKLPNKTYFDYAPRMRRSAYGFAKNAYKKVRHYK